jgi:hypothetical protein
MLAEGRQSRLIGNTQCHRVRQSPFRADHERAEHWFQSAGRLSGGALRCPIEPATGCPSHSSSQRSDALTCRKAGCRWVQTSPSHGEYEERGRSESAPRAIIGSVNALLGQSAPAFVPSLRKSRNQFERTCW